jgi:hypothetical protein
MIMMRLRGASAAAVEGVEAGGFKRVSKKF